MQRALMLEVLQQFRVLLRSMDNHYRQIEKRSGLGGAQIWALAEISQGDGIGMGELSAKLAIQISTASNLVSRLEDLGLVKRVRGTTDQRIVRLTATPAGRRKLRQAPRPSAGLLQDALFAMGVKELKALRAQLGGLLRAMGHVDRSARGMPLGEMLGGRAGSKAPKGAGKRGAHS